MRSQLISKIETVFADVPYPGDENIGRLSVEEFIGQKDWQNVPLEMLLNNQSEIPAFSSDAFHFFLPAFLRAVLQYPEAEIMLDYVIESLFPSPTLHMDFISERAIGLFNNEEKTVVLEFLEKLQELFPHSNFNMLENNSLELQRAIQFWREN